MQILSTATKLLILVTMVNLLTFSLTTPAQDIQPMQVTIDVNPDQSENSVPLGASYAIPVVILSGDDFDAAAVNPETLTLSGGPISKDDEERLFSIKDVNSDGVNDMLVYFAADYTELNENSTEVVLKGSTNEGLPLEGRDYARFFRTDSQQSSVKELNASGNGLAFAAIMAKPAFIIGYAEAVYNYIASFFASPVPADDVSTFSNSTKIDIPASGNTSGNSSPYPSQITVSNVTGNVKKVTVALNGISHSSPDDIDILLVGPTGKALVLMSDAGGNPDITNLTITFDDAALSQLQDTGLIASNNAVVSFLPTNHPTSVDNFLNPAPSTYENPGPQLSGSNPGTARLSVFNGLDPNGIWKLFIRDDNSGDIGSIANGWTLNITTEPTDTTAPTLNLPGNITQEATSASGADVNFTATAMDADPAAPVVNCNPSSGSTFALGTTTVDCSATDNYNNTANGSFTVTVNDTTAPQIAGVSNITVDAASPSGAAVIFNGVGATDTVDSTPTLTFNPPSGNTFPIGTTSVTITAKDNYNNTSSTSFDVTVNRLTTSITGLSNPTVITYGQSVPQTATVQNGPSGAIIAYTIASGYNIPADSSGFGLINNPLAVGDYTLKADYAGNNIYAGSSAVVNLTVKKAGATITLSDLLQTYNGSPKSATVTKNPTNLSGVSVTYNGSTTAPTNAGSYEVVATLVNDNYKLVDGQDQDINDVKGTLVIEKATVTLELVQADLAQTYNGAARTVGFTVNPANVTGVAVTYDGSTTAPTNAGSYSVVAKLTNDNYKADDAAGTLVISQADQAALIVSSPTAGTFGQVLSPIVSGGTTGGAVTFNAGSSTACQIGTGVNANKLVITSGTGTCAITATMAGDNNYKDVTSAPRSVAINKANQVITGFDLSGLSKTFGDLGFNISAIPGASGNAVIFSTTSTACSVLGTTVTIKSSGTCQITANQAGNNDYNAAPPVSQSFTIATRDALVRYIGQTQWVTSGTSSTTAQVTLTASVQDPTGFGLSGAKVDFIDAASSKVLASNVNVSPVAGSPSNTGTANTIVTLSSGQYGAESYVIAVRLTGNYENDSQPEADKTAALVVSKPAGTNEASGGGTIKGLVDAAGTYRSNADVNSTFSVGMTYNKSGTNPQGKITITIPQPDGSTIYVKSNSITSMSNSAFGSGNTGGKKSIIYTKSSINKVVNGTTVTIEGNVSLRVDITDYASTATPDEIGFTVLSSSNSNLFYSNRWVLESGAWKTLPQQIAGTMKVN